MMAQLQEVWMTAHVYFVTYFLQVAIKEEAGQNPEKKKDLKEDVDTDMVAKSGDVRS